MALIDEAAGRTIQDLTQPCLSMCKRHETRFEQLVARHQAKKFAPPLIALSKQLAGMVKDREQDSRQTNQDSNFWV